MKDSRYRVFLTKDAQRNIGKLDPSIRKTITKAIESLAIHPFKGKPLAYDLAGLHSLRTADYRINYRIREVQLIIIAVAVGHRQEIYKRLKLLLSGL